MSIIRIPGSDSGSRSEINETDASESVKSALHNVETDISEQLSENEEDSTDSEDGYSEDPSNTPPPDRRLELCKTTLERYQKSGRVDDAMREYVKLTALNLLVYGPKHWRYAEAYTDLAAAYLDLKGSLFGQQAEQHGEFAKSILLSVKSTSTSEVDKADIFRTLIHTYHVLARAKALLKKLTDAENLINKALSVVSDLSRLSVVTNDDEITEITIKLHSTAAKIALRNEKNAVACSHHESALKMTCHLYGEDAVELIPLYQAMGQAEQANGKLANHERAVQLYLEAHTLANKHYDGSSPEVIETARALAIAYSKSGQPEAESSAESYLNECLAKYISMFGPCHPSVCQVQKDLACLLIRTGRERDGIQLCEKNVKLELAVYGEFSEEVLQSYKLIGSTYLSQEQLPEALTEFEKCYAIEEFVYGKNSRRARETQSILDTIRAHPALSSKQGQNDLKNRPRFNNLVKPNRLPNTGTFNQF